MAQEPILIVGQGRSGTTLLAAMLGRHPELASTAETYFWRDVAQYSGGWDRIVSDWPASGILFLQQMDRWGEIGLNANMVAATVGSAAPSDPGQLFRAMCEQAARSVGKQRTVEKTPAHIQHIPLIRRWMPKAPIIHIIRDGRDVAMSRQKLPWLPKSFCYQICEWKRRVCLGEERLRGNMYAMTVRYEDLVTETERTLRQICEFVGVRFDEALLHPEGGSSSVIEKNAWWKEGAKQSVSRDRLEAWRRELPWSLQRAAWALAGDVLQRWSYSPPSLQEGRPNNGLCVYMSTDVETDEQGRLLDELVVPLAVAGVDFRGPIDFFNDALPCEPGMILLTDSPLTVGWQQLNRTAVLLRLMKFKFKLQTLRRRKLRLIWIRPNLKPSEPVWPLRKKVERWVTAAAERVLDSDNVNTFKQLADELLQEHYRK